MKAVNGRETLELAQKHEEELSVILLDLVMPEMNGYQFLDLYKGKMKKSVPVIVLTQKEGVENEIDILSRGASDYLPKPYNSELIRHRVRNIISLRESSMLIANIQSDALTGLYTKEMFFREARQLLRDNPAKRYDIICADIDNFKLVNELYGTAAGDAVLKCLADDIKESMEGHGICGRIGADVFAGLVPHRDTYTADMFAQQIQRINSCIPNSKLTLRYGIYFVEDSSKSVSAMCDRAQLAIRTIKGKYEAVFAYYNEELHEKMMLEQKMTNAMEASLKNEDFKVFFQPKYELSTGKIAGAEALVRWIHPEMGFLSPGGFIPLFERNGFIFRLDRFVWEKACQWIKTWKDKGYRPVPVSVNVSRADLYNPTLQSVLDGLIQKYGLTPSALHLEITETAYTINPEQVIQVVSALRNKSYPIEMDDFGTGYSSLNMLSELPIDILKMDMRFIQSSGSKNSVNILGFIICLAKWLHLRVIAEGVETQEQIDLLKNLDCTYVQGFYYAKPMSAEEFEQCLHRDGLTDTGMLESSRPLSGPVIHTGANQRVLLVVDDVESNRAILVELFKDRFTVVEADNGELAMQYLREHAESVEIVLLDLLMPVMDGFQVIKHMKEDPRLCDIPIVVTTAASEDNEEQTLALGVNEFLGKPYRPSIVKMRVENVITCNRVKLEQKRGERNE